MVYRDPIWQLFYCRHMCLDKKFLLKNTNLSEAELEITITCSCMTLDVYGIQRTEISTTYAHVLILFYYHLVIIVEVIFH